jgi:glycine oxidase
MQRCEYLQRDALEQVNPHISDQFQEAIYFPELSNIRNPRITVPDSLFKTTSKC